MTNRTSAFNLPRLTQFLVVLPRRRSRKMRTARDESLTGSHSRWLEEANLALVKGDFTRVRYPKSLQSHVLGKSLCDASMRRKFGSRAADKQSSPSPSQTPQTCSHEAPTRRWLLGKPSAAFSVLIAVLTRIYKPEGQPRSSTMPSTAASCGTK